MTVRTAVSQFERDLLIERTQDGLACAKAESKRLGRKTVLRPEQITEIRAKLAVRATAWGLAREYAVLHSTILKVAQFG